MSILFKEFPPGLAHVHVPISSTGAAHAGLSLYAPCRPFGLILHAMAWWATSFFGPSILPGRAREWNPLTDHDAWCALKVHLAAEFGPFHSIAGLQRTQGNRDGFILILIRENQPGVFLKVRHGADPNCARELWALERLALTPPSTFRVPDLLGSAHWRGWHYIAQYSLPPVPHSPLKYPKLPLIGYEIERIFHDLERPSGVSKHWQPMHGDLTPWNLRQTKTGLVYLLDWEEIGWGPPGSDEVLYTATAAAVLGVAPSPLNFPEAIHYWQNTFGLRMKLAKSSRDQRLAHQVLDILEKMEKTTG